LSQLSSELSSDMHQKLVLVMVPCGVSFSHLPSSGGPFWSYFLFSDKCQSFSKVFSEFCVILGAWVCLVLIFWSVFKRISFFFPCVLFWMLCGKKFVNYTNLINSVISLNLIKVLKFPHNFTSRTATSNCKPVCFCLVFIFWFFNYALGVLLDLLEFSV
jgi:hypothetical protein